VPGETLNRVEHFEEPTVVGHDFGEVLVEG
jgi:hypothetical protein